MKIWKHFMVVLLLACSMTYYLYSYKPRHYTLPGFIETVIVNVSLWVFIFGILYLVVALLVKLVKRYLIK